MKDKLTQTVKEAQKNIKALGEIKELVWSIQRLIRKARKVDQNFLPEKSTEAIIQDLLSSLQHDLRLATKDLILAKKRIESSDATPD